MCIYKNILRYIYFIISTGFVILDSLYTDKIIDITPTRWKTLKMVLTNVEIWLKEKKMESHK